MELGSEPPSIEFFTVSEVKGLDFIEAVRNFKPDWECRPSLADASPGEGKSLLRQLPKK
jgi:hypothetical protein